MPEDSQQPVQTEWKYSPEEDESEMMYGADGYGDFQDSEPISWQASEYISQEKTLTWYVGLGVAISIVCSLLFIVSRDFLSIGFIVVMGILFAVIASRKPRQLQYQIDHSGISIGSRQYGFHDFKSFSVQHDGAVGYVSLLPLKRFLPELVIYYAPEDEDVIIDALARNIPNEDHRETLVDKFARIIRF